MVKARMEDNTVASTIRPARAVNFDLSTPGQQELTNSGVSAQFWSLIIRRLHSNFASSKRHPPFPPFEDL
jgi:hypothetical protein